MAETKTVNLRLPLSIVDYVTNEEGINQGVVNALNDLILLHSISMQEIKGVFTQEEWKFLSDSLNGSLVTDSFRVSKEALIAHNEDAEMYENTASKWGVDIKEMNEKIAKLSGAQIEAIYRRVERFWTNDTDLEKWSDF